MFSIRRSIANAARAVPSSPLTAVVAPQRTVSLATQRISSASTATTSIPTRCGSVLSARYFSCQGARLLEDDVGSTASYPPRDGNKSSTSSSSSPSSSPFVKDGEAPQTPPAPPMTTIWVRNLPFSIEETTLQDAFGRFGKIEDVKHVRKAENAQRFGTFILFDSAEAAAAAAEAADGSYFHGRKLGVQAVRTWRARATGGLRREDFPPTGTVYVGNLPFELADEDLGRLFDGLDGLENVRASMHKASGKFMGYLHASFRDKDAAVAAVEKLRGAEVGGRRIRISHAVSSTYGAGRDGGAKDPNEAEEVREHEPVQSGEPQKGEVPPP